MAGVVCELFGVENADRVEAVCVGTGQKARATTSNSAVAAFSSRRKIHRLVSAYVFIFLALLFAFLRRRQRRGRPNKKLLRMKSITLKMITFCVRGLAMGKKTYL